MSVEKVKKVLKESTESNHITIKVQRNRSGFDIYSYVILPIEIDDQTEKESAEALAIMSNALFGKSKIDAVLFPQAKPFLYAGHFKDFTGIPAVYSRKRLYGVPDEIVITVKTAYGDTTYLSCMGLKGKGNIIIGDDTISGGDTMHGHSKAIREQAPTKLGHDVNVLGGISVYERGRGLIDLNEKEPERTWAGFGRLDIIPKEGMESVINDKYGGNAESVASDIFYKDLRERFGDFADEELMNHFLDLPENERVPSYAALGELNKLIRPQVSYHHF